MAKTKSRRTKSKPAVKSKAVAKPKSVAKKKPAAIADASLGRPLVTQEERLYMLFKDDYQARQIFEFLRANTVHDLVQLSPMQISRIVAKPLHDTIDRIRQRLAEMKRSLRDDADFAADYRRQMSRK